MSVPDSLTMPRCARRVEYASAQGPLAALEAVPRGPVRATALLVPGFTGSKEDFLPLLRPLADSGVRAVAVDQRGQCDSPGLPREQDYGLAGFGAEVRALLDLVGGEGPLHLLGHSFGGHVVREALLGAPGALPIHSLTIMDSGPAAAVGPARDRIEAFLAVSQSLSLAGIHELEPVDRHPDPAVREFLLRRWLSNDRASMRAIARVLLSEPDRTGELRARLAEQALPCLLVAGVDEDVWPVGLQRETALRLGARFAAIPGAGHSPNTQQPEPLAKVLLDFWLG